MPATTDAGGDHEIAYAKINLALHVRHRRADGYHELETLFAFAEDGDRLTVTKADALDFTLSGPFAAALAHEDPAGNLVMRAAVMLKEAFAIGGGAALRLDKRLPVASGIGGGSADAAAALRLLCRHWGLDRRDPRVMAIARQLGADVPACLESATVRGEGRGDTLIPTAGALAGLPVLLVNPRVALSTAAVFSGWSGQDRGVLAMGDPMSAAIAGRNDLEAPARAVVPVIGDVLDRLGKAAGASLARMSGSGATCFALFSDDALRDRAAAELGVARPTWWQLPTRLR